MKKLKDEKGSITIYVLATMLFFVTILTLNYSRQVNELNNQKKEIKEIEKQYNVDDKLEETYYKIQEKKQMLNPGDTAFSTVKDNYSDINNNKATIPKGFEVSETDNIINKGLVVIGPDGSEFVWVPVPNPISEEINDKPMAKELIDTNGNKYYQGVLYRFIEPSGGTGPSTSRENPNSNKNTPYGQETASYREPGLVTGDSNVTKALYGSEDEIVGDGYDKVNASNAGYEDTQKFGKAMQEDYNNMVKSVNTYKGFYVGRYEMSLTGADGENQGTGTAQSKGNVLSSKASNENSKMWYGLYSKAKTYSTGNKEDNTTIKTESVVSGMIWGSQWDAMLNWMQGNGVNIASETPNGASYNTTQLTGNESLDKINNVYDLLGCIYDWTLEANSTFQRIERGGYYNGSGLPSDRGNSSPTAIYSSNGTRLALYIK